MWMPAQLRVALARLHCGFTYLDNATANATIAAVSARRMLGPSDAVLHPLWLKRESSISVHPPSGPTANENSESSLNRSLSFRLRSFSARTIGVPRALWIIVAVRSGAAISGEASR